MQITLTRKAIIDLIEPYMDKTLSEGCIYYNLFNNRLEEIGDGGKITEDKDGKYYEYGFDFHKIDKIIGHYDITALLDYINSININGVGVFYFDNVIWHKDKWVFQKTDHTGYIEILKKPLHLYTEKEEKKLLELIKLK